MLPLELDNDVIPLISPSPQRFSAKILKHRKCYSKRQFMLEIAFAILPNRTRKFYQEISFSAFNNFHIIQFYFQFPIARKKLWWSLAMLLCVSHSKAENFLRGLLKCHRILWDIYSARPDSIRPNSKKFAINSDNVVSDYNRQSSSTFISSSCPSTASPFSFFSFSVNKLSTQQSNQTLSSRTNWQPHTERANRTIENPLDKRHRTTDCDALTTQIFNNSLKKAIIPLYELRFVYFRHEKEKNAVEAKQSK